MTTPSIRIRTVAVAAAFGLAGITGAIGLPAALDPIPAASAQINPGVAPSTIDVTRLGSITINKRLDADTSGGAQDTGNPNPDAGGTPRAGVNFRLEKLNADLGTNAGWQAAQSLTVGSPRDGNFLARNLETNDAGVARFSNLPVGVYVVTETGKPDSIVPTAPFLVYIPMTNPANRTEWNYDVNVYPKNATNEAAKFVDDADANVGDTITYTIVADVPAPASAAVSLTRYELRDFFDWASVSTDASRISASLSNGTELLPTDYTISANSGQVITVAFTEAGLTKLTAEKRTTPSLAVTFAIEGTVNAVGATDGTASNSASVVSNNGTGTDSTSSTQTVESKWGKLQIIKQNDQSTPAPLGGAVFQLFECTDSTGAGGAGGVRLGDAPLTVNGRTSWTTAAGGTVEIDGLHVTDFVNSSPISTTPDLFCLVETQAPEGYEMLARPVPVSFTRADLANTEDGTDALTVRATVTNVASTQANLPLTGGQGIGILAAVGALIIGTGVWYARKVSKKA